MLTLSDDKSAYATLKGLVEYFTERVDNLKTVRARLDSVRSRQYHSVTGEIAGLNDAIGTIYITDVWHEGQYQEKQAKSAPPHMHAQHLGVDTVLRDDTALQEYLKVHNAHEASLWYASVVVGIEVTACIKSECLVPQM